MLCLLKILSTKILDILFGDIFVKELDNDSLITDWIVGVFEFFQFLLFVVYESLFIFLVHRLCNFINSEQS